MPAKGLKGEKVDAYKHSESTHHTQSNDTSHNCCSCILHTVNLRYLLCTSLESLSLMHKNPHLSSGHSEILHNSLLFIAPPNPTHPKKTHIDHSIVILTCFQLLSIELNLFCLRLLLMFHRFKEASQNCICVGHTQLEKEDSHLAKFKPPFGIQLFFSRNAPKLL